MGQLIVLILAVKGVIYMGIHFGLLVTLLTFAIAPIFPIVGLVSFFL